MKGREASHPKRLNLPSWLFLELKKKRQESLARETLGCRRQITCNRIYFGGESRRATLRERMKRQVNAIGKVKPLTARIREKVN